jgi:hypothetical protein
MLVPALQIIDNFYYHVSNVNKIITGIISMPECLTVDVD